MGILAFVVPTLVDYCFSFLQILTDSAPVAVAADVSGLASLAAMVWLTVECGILHGTPGPNRYGPDPLAEAADTAIPAASGAGDVG